MCASSRIGGYSLDQRLRGLSRTKRKLSDSERPSALSTNHVEGSSNDDNSDSETPQNPVESQLIRGVEDRVTFLRRTRSSNPSLRPTTATRDTFASLGISLPLQKALTGMSIKVPTEVQAACIPPLLTGEF